MLSRFRLRVEEELMNAPLLVLVITGGLLAFGSGTSAQPRHNLLCSVTKKADGENDYSREQLERGGFAVRLRHASDKLIVERFSFAPSQRRVTCDPYVVDQVAYDAVINATKYYLFRGQFDLQVFNDLSFVENNGRGVVAWGRCAVE